MSNLAELPERAAKDLVARCGGGHERMPVEPDMYAVQSTDGRPLPRGSGQRLLVVDDHPRITELLQTTLSLAGYRVSAASTGAQALRAYRGEQVDLLVLEVMLPCMDGFTVCRRLTEQGTCLPVLFLTARDAVEDRLTGFAMGADDYLTKRFRGTPALFCQR